MARSRTARAQTSRKPRAPHLRVVDEQLARELVAPWRKAREILRAYDAGKSGRRTEGWYAGGGSANGEITPSLSAARNRARDLVRNNPYARRALDTLTAKKVGTGIIARPDKGAAAAWEEFFETCDFEGDLDLAGMQSMMARTADEAGEVLLRRIRTREGRVPLKLQILEPDYIDTTKFGATQAGNYIIAGVEIDSLGRRQALWLYDRHPGESVLVPRALESRRVEASEIVHFYEKLRPGQLRGFPRLAASMLRLRNLDEYKEAELVRKKIEACFVAFVHGGDPGRPLAEAKTDASTGKRTETLAPGIIEYLGGNETVSFGNPSVAGDSDFTKEELHAIAVGAGVTYEQLTGDLSGVNFSSIRAGQGDFRDLVDAWRWIFFIPMAMRRVKDWFLEAAYTAGAIRTNRYKFVWTPPAWPYVNPKDDISAIKEEIKGGLQSLSEKIRERGYDPQQVFAEIKEEREQLKKDGIAVDTNVSTAPKPAVPAADGKAPEDDKSESGDSDKKPVDDAGEPAEQ
jgi:lambda family phage portal protein